MSIYDFLLAVMFAIGHDLQAFSNLLKQINIFTIKNNRPGPR
jgi:hypothetical protein